MDVVYFLKHSPFDDFEIRYSLRSVAKHLPCVRKVWVFGDRPKFLSRDTSIVEHVPHDTIAPVLGFRVPMTNFFQMLFASSLIPELNEEYLWFCDDFFLLKDLPLESARNLRYLEDLDKCTTRNRGLWVDSLWRTYELLKRLNYPRLNFETHVPTYYRRKWPLEAYRDFRDYVTNDRWFGMLGPTAILNHAVQQNGLQPISIHDEQSRAGFWGKQPSYEEVRKESEQRLFLNFDDEAFGPGIRQFLEERFPEPCRYELEDNREGVTEQTPTTVSTHAPGKAPATPDQTTEDSAADTQSTGQQERKPSGGTSKGRILVALYHSYIDTSSGAAISLRDLMEALAQHGWEVRVFSGPRVDFEEPKLTEELLTEQGIRFKTYRASENGVDIRLSLFRSNGVDCGVWSPSDPQADPSKEVGTAWLNAYREILESWQPDLVITYGGFWMTAPLAQLARKAGARTIFYLCNYGYTDGALFREFDITITLSEFHAQWYRENVGIQSVPIYPLMPPERYLCEPDLGRRFVTFINPQPHKGVYVFAKIAEVLGKRRPDIPFLVVEGRASVDWLARTGADLSQANLHRMRNTPDPREYLRVTKVMLVPSVWQESFGRVAAEAMMNGIPVIGSDRGSLPEVIGDGSTVLEIPERISPQSREMITDVEAEAWVNAIVRYWDDPSHSEETAKVAKERARNWSHERIMENIDGLFSEIRNESNK